jgi:'Cold-shock' DNA-binding domain
LASHRRASTAPPRAAALHANGVSTSTSFDALQPGDEVEFEVIIDSRSGKLRAIDVVAVF